ncbi:MAG TPA: B12-binding domain-containing radical SAM protein, partial [Clostridia bacterium]|nr:B12-binding domain-containing radical SAM protein [Clostridia bacterium]
MNRDMGQRLEMLLEEVQRPARYTGGEVNAIKKEWRPGRTAFCFAFPDTYEVAMSHLGMKIIYEAVNAREDMLCERVMMPWADMADGLKAAGIPLYSLESRRALSEFDAVGFTLQYEMSYTNILAMLDLGGIALRGGQRGERAPFVIAGGPCAANPEPLAEVVDAFLMGDGETATVQMLEVIGAGRREGLRRERILLRLAGIPGIYVPSLYESVW